MIKIGIIGTGFGAKIHLPGLKSIPEVKVVGIYGREFTKTQSIAKLHNIPIVFKHWEDLVNEKQIEAVTIAMPPHLHARIALKAINNKKAILCEKPLARSLIEAQKMLIAATTTKIIHTIDFEYRYLPAFITLKKLLSQKTIGQPRYINIIWTSGGRANKDISINWSNYKKYGGGVLLNLASHVIDYVEWLFGSIKEVSGKLSIIKHFKGNIENKPDADDLITAQLKLKNGTVCNLFITNVVFGGQGQRLDIYGDKGTITLQNRDVRDFGRNFELFITYPNDLTKKITIPKLPNTKKTNDSRIVPFTALSNDFIKGIKKHRLLAPSFVQGERVQKVITAIQKSAKKNLWTAV